MIDLPQLPRVSAQWGGRLLRLLESTRDDPQDLPDRVRDELDVDLTARYAGLAIRHPFGKASGQLSCTLHQVAADVEAGLAFVVLKTVIAESPDGRRSMEEWSVPETRMRVEPRIAPDGRRGWTVTWTGRGWSGSLGDYLEFFAGALDIARPRDVPVIPSVKYHLPSGGEPVCIAEYRHTTQCLLAVWDRAGCGGPMVLEKDLSPTLAGDERAQQRDTVLRWVEEIPRLVDAAAPRTTRLGIKLMNALFDDAFQLEIVRSAAERADPRPAFLVVFNRLFDRERGLAYGGWELSDRNLRVLDLLRYAQPSLEHLPPLCATGNICSGRVMVHYAMRGCESGQIHTFFQLPLSQYTATGGSRSARALHTLLLHPTEGLAVWLRHLNEAGLLEERGGKVCFLDLVGREPGDS